MGKKRVQLAGFDQIINKQAFVAGRPIISKSIFVWAIFLLNNRRSRFLNFNSCGTYFVLLMQQYFQTNAGNQKVIRFASLSKFGIR